MGRLVRGDLLPWLTSETGGGKALLRVESIAGHFALFCFPQHPEKLTHDILELLSKKRGNTRILLFIVSREEVILPGDPIVLLDPEDAIARAFGATSGMTSCFVSDPSLMLLYEKDFLTDAEALTTLTDLVGYLPPELSGWNRNTPPPILLREAVFEPELSSRIIAEYRSGRQFASPALTIEDGAAAPQYSARKSRTDGLLQPDASAIVQERLWTRLAPVMRQAFQFEVTGIDRVVVGCYDAANGGRFDAHRDNTLDATRHRRFAVTVNLNDDYEGGYLGFPEYTGTLYRPPPGGAIVFSCSLMHLVTPVTKGCRYAVLFFLT